MLYLTSGASLDGWSMFSTIVQLFFILLIFGGIVVAAIFVTKWVASAKYTKKGNNLQLMESMSLGYQSGVHLLRCGKKYVLLGITKDKISLLAQIEEEDIDPLYLGKNNAKIDFNKYLESILQRNAREKDDEDV